MAPKVFFSYAHSDEALRDELAKHLTMLKRNGEISDWYDRDINAGASLDDEINSALESSQIVLCLLSPDFIASHYCYEREMKRALERRRAGHCEVIPVILRPCDWLETPLAALRATPNDGKPVTTLPDRDAAFLNVAADIRRVARGFGPLTAEERLAKPSAQNSIAASSAAAGNVSKSRFRRKFNDAERDTFLETAFEQLATFFERETSIVREQAAHLDGRYTRIDARAFTASIYENGKRAASASVWHDGRAIYYSNQAQANRGSYNESLSIGDDGFELHLKPLGMSTFRMGQGPMSAAQAADHLWGLMTNSLGS